MRDMFENDSGAVTVDWVVLTAALVGLGLAAMSVVSGGVEDLANDTNDSLNRSIVETSLNFGQRVVTSMEDLNLMGYYANPEGRLASDKAMGDGELVMYSMLMQARNALNNSASNNDRSEISQLAVYELGLTDMTFEEAAGTLSDYELARRSLQYSHLPRNNSFPQEHMDNAIVAFDSHIADRNLGNDPLAAGIAQLSDAELQAEHAEITQYYGTSWNPAGYADVMLPALQAEIDARNL